ncbi:amidohydrolase [Risungbinella massiliensis]|uniref:amidohydrolase n=1 Tax=Risungbinella massiliensis TaxID=1329796 RepID=UPI000699E638|nr:amidohydrolase [Risungbinella massiliensis]
MTSKKILHHFIMPNHLFPHQALEAIYLENGRIQAMGSRKEILLQYGRPDVEKIDLAGGYLTPGLVDSHLHLSLLGQKLLALDLSGASSKQELLERVRATAHQIKPESWIVGQGWNEAEFQGEIPTLEELDQVAPHHPILLIRVCHHVYLANTLASHRAGVRPHEEDPAEGRYGRDLTGRWDGLVYENASFPFHHAIPEPSKLEIKEIFRRAMREALAGGLTGVHTEDMRLVKDAELLNEIMQELHEEGVRLRTHHLIYYPYLEQVEDRTWRRLVDSPFFRVGAIKLFSDGSLGGRTAWLTEPYLDDPNTTGLSIHNDEEIQQIARNANEIGLPIAVHAIGDQATQQVVETMRQIPAPPETTLRHRLIHACILSPELVDQIASLPIIVDLQPLFAQSDRTWLPERLGRKRLAQSFLWKTLLQKGIPCAAGTDAPIEQVAPIYTIQAALRRLDWDGKTSSPESLTWAEILAMYTTGSAYAVGEEKERGKIAVDYYADFTVWDRPIDSETGEYANVTHTICNGEIAYQAE